MRITTVKEQPKDRAYWATQPLKRLAAVEFLRQQYIGPTHAEQRLQRVCRIAAEGMPAMNFIGYHDLVINTKATGRHRDLNDVDNMHSE